MADQINIALNQLLSNNFVSSAVTLGLSFYAYKAGPELPSYVEELFENVFFQIFVGFMVLYMNTRNFMLSLVVSIVFVYGMKMFSGLKEGMEGMFMGEDMGEDMGGNDTFNCDPSKSIRKGGSENYVFCTFVNDKNDDDLNKKYKKILDDYNEAEKSFRKTRNYDAIRNAVRTKLEKIRNLKNEYKNDYQKYLNDNKDNSIFSKDDCIKYELIGDLDNQSFDERMKYDDLCTRQQDKELRRRDEEMRGLHGW